jgi:hypothetical protein
MISMNLQTMFIIELVLGAVMLTVMVGLLLYLAMDHRRLRRETGRQVGTADIPVGLASREPTEGATERATPRHTLRREFYKSIGPRRGEEMKLRLYSPENYQHELGGDGSALKRSGFVAALRAYRMLEDEWLEYPPQPAAKVIRLTPEDYKVDEEHKALLLRRLPHGFPLSARDAI